MNPSLCFSERLYFHDSYLHTFDAQVLSTSDDGLRVVLNRTAFYPTSGGQPHDLGALNDSSVLDVLDLGDRIEHLLSAPLAASQVQGRIDWPRRLDHMVQHTGQHLLSAILQENFGLSTVSFHMGSAVSTIDVEPFAVPEETLRAAELLASETVRRNLPTRVSFEDAATAQGLRKPSDRSGLLRIVTIDGLDRSACGGTHVGHTGEIGLIALGKTEKIRQSLRIEFYCGARALSYLRGQLSSSLQEASQLRARLADSDKAARRLSLELASLRGAHRAASGVREWVEEVAEISEALRHEANAYLESSSTAVLLYAPSSGAILLGAHPSRGLDCGRKLKDFLFRNEGRGGGTPRLAQGTAPVRLTLERLSVLFEI